MSAEGPEEISGGGGLRGCLGGLREPCVLGGGEGGWRMHCGLGRGGEDG